MKPHRQSLCRLLPTLLVLALLLAACQQRGRYHAQLAYIDSLADVRPAEADSLLRALAPAMPSASEADSMHYALMRLKTDDKLYRPITDRQPLALRLVDYYEHHHKGALLPTALFYAGRVSTDLGDAPQALDYYQHGLLLIDNSDDERLGNSFHEQMGYIFLNQDLYDDAMRQFCASYEFNKQQKDTIGMIFNLRDIAIVSEFQKNDVRADSFYQKSYQLAVEKGDVSLRNMVLLQMASLHRRQGKTEQAIKEIRPSLLNMDTASISAIYSIASRIYMDAKKTDSARLFLDKLLVYGNVYGKQCAHLSLMELDARDGNAMASLRHLTQYRIYEDSVHRMDNASVVKRMNAMYNYQLHEKEAKHLSILNERMQWSIVVLLLILTLLALVSLLGWRHYVYRRRLLNARIEKLSILNVENEKIISEKRTQVQEMEKRLTANTQETKILAGKILKLTNQKDEGIRLSAINQGIIRQLQDQLAQLQEEKKNLEMELEALMHSLDYAEKIQIIEQKQKAEAYNIVDNSHIAVTFKRKLQQNKNITEEEWEQLAVIINKAYPRFTTRLNELNPMTEQQLRISLLLKLGMKTNEIAQLTNRASSTISTTLQRLYDKTLKENGAYKDWRDFIRKL